MEYKIIIQGIGQSYFEHINLLRYYELKNEIRIIGVTGAEKGIAGIDGYRFIPKEDLKNVEFDYLVVATPKFYKEIIKENVEMGIPREKMIPVKVFSLVDFCMSQYIKLKESRLTIISPHCWGGFTYNSLGLPFNSPFINMFERHDDYLKILRNMQYYMNCEIELLQYEWEHNLKRYYPVAACGDVKLFFNHYETFDEAYAKWNERKCRINMENIFVQNYTESKQELEEFDKLPYKNKVCFVPFRSEVESAVYLPRMDGESYAASVIRTARGRYNLLSLLCEGKKDQASRCIWEI